MTKQGDIDKEITNWTKISKYIDDLLTDERSTIGDINRSSLTFRLEDLHGSSMQGSANNQSISLIIKNTPKNNMGEQYIKWNKKNASKLALKNADYAFGMYHLSTVAVMILLPLIGYHLYEYLSNFSEVERVMNLVDLFTLMAEMRNVHSIMRQSLLSTIFWNNTSPILGRPAAETYELFSGKMRNSIILSLNSKRSLDYGTEFNSYFSKITSNYNVCKLVTTFGTGYSRCGDSALTSIDFNFIMFMRSLASLTDDMYMNWNSQNRDPKLAQEMMRIPKFINYMGATYNFSIVDDLYYTIQKPLSVELVTRLEPIVTADSSSPAVKNSNIEPKVAVLHHPSDSNNLDYCCGFLRVRL